MCSASFGGPKKSNPGEPNRSLGATHTNSGTTALPARSHSLDDWSYLITGTIKVLLHGITTSIQEKQNQFEREGGLRGMLEAMTNPGCLSARFATDVTFARSILVSLKSLVADLNQAERARPEKVHSATVSQDSKNPYDIPVQIESLCNFITLLDGYAHPPESPNREDMNRFRVNLKKRMASLLKQVAEINKWHSQELKRLTT